MSEAQTLRDTVALNDGAAHARVLGQQLALAVNEIVTRYPNNRLGGLIERLQELTVFASGHAQALGASADAAMRARPEIAGLGEDAPIAAPRDVLHVFEAATVLTEFISVAEAQQATQGGRLVILRDRTAQASHLVPKGAVIFEAEVDPALVRLWWPRVFSRELAVAILPTEVEGVWLETTYASEDLPAETTAARVAGG